MGQISDGMDGYSGDILELIQMMIGRLWLRALMKLLVCEIEKESAAVGFDQNMRNAQLRSTNKERIGRDEAEAR